MGGRRDYGAVERRPMTSDEERMSVQVGVCRFRPGGIDARLARALRDRVYGSLQAGPAAEISEGEARMLRVLVHRYRRQLDAATIALAGPPRAGA